MQAAKVIHNTWLFEQSRLKARLLETLLSVSRSINSALHVDEALQLITREACALMEARMASLLLLDPSGQWLDLRASSGAGPSYLAKPRLSVDESFMGIVVRRKKPMQLENVQSSTLYQIVAVARRGGPGFPFERPAGLQRPNHRHSQRLYRRSLIASPTRKSTS